MGLVEDPMVRDGLTVFVTVGSTKFDELIKKMLSTEVVDVLISLGFKRMVMQVGDSDFAKDQVDSLQEKIDMQTYRFKSSILSDIFQADLVVGHAGAGTSVETLRMHKKLLMVINDNLMDKHQNELAEALNERNLAMCTNVDNLAENLTITWHREFDQMMPANMSKFDEILGNLIGSIKRLM